MWLLSLWVVDTVVCRVASCRGCGSVAVAGRYAPIRLGASSVTRVVIDRGVGVRSRPMRCDRGARRG